MDAYVVCLLFLSREISAVIFNEDNVKANFSYQFVAAIVEKSSYDFVALGVVVSPHWVLSVAHAFPPDSDGLACDNYSIVAGRPWRVYTPKYAITHPAYTWGLYTPEDFALFYVEAAIPVRPVFVSAGRFPWNWVDCDFIYWSESTQTNFTEGLVMSFKSRVTVVQNCLAKKQRKPMGLLGFYVNDILCAKGDGNHPKACVGEKGGILYCQNLFVGVMIRHEWCQDKTANFTDVGAYTNWLHSRVSDGWYIGLHADGMSTGVLPQKVMSFLAVAYFNATTFWRWFCCRSSCEVRMAVAAVFLVCPMCSIGSRLILEYRDSYGGRKTV